MANLEDMTAKELQNFKAGIDMEKLSDVEKAQLPALDALITQKVAEEAVAANEAGKTFKSLSKKLDAKTKKDYPELNDKNSEMTKKTDAYLEQMGTAMTDPTALATAASLAADDLGLAPSQYRQTPDPGKTGTGEGKPLEDGNEPVSDFRKRTSKLAGLLEREGVLDQSKEGVMDRIEGNYERNGEEL